MPFMIDFMILLPALTLHSDIREQMEMEPESDDDEIDTHGAQQMVEEFGGYESSEDCIGAIYQHLQDISKKYVCLDVDDDQFDIGSITRDLEVMITNALNELKSKTNVNYLKNRRVNMVIDLKKSKTNVNYLKNRRVNMVIDLREEYRKDDQNVFAVFEPPKTCNTIPVDPLLPPEYYFDQSRICLIPRPVTENTPKIDATETLQGQLLTLSYHVNAADDIKCYLLWQGCSQRFYPQDIVEVLPKLFVCDHRDTFGNKEFAESVGIKRLASKMKITDTKFEEFYRSINRLNEKEFPKQFELPPEKYLGQAIVSDRETNPPKLPNALQQSQIGNNPSSLKQFNQQQLVSLLMNHELFDDSMINQHKSQIINYIKDNNIDGDELSKMSRKTFSQNMITFCQNNKRVRGPSNKTWDRLVKYQSTQHPQSAEQNNMGDIEESKDEEKDDDVEFATGIIELFLEESGEQKERNICIKLPKTLTQELEEIVNIVWQSKKTNDKQPIFSGVCATQCNGDTGDASQQHSSSNSQSDNNKDKDEKQNNANDSPNNQQNNNDESYSGNNNGNNRNNDRDGDGDEKKHNKDSDDNDKDKKAVKKEKDEDDDDDDDAKDEQKESTLNADAADFTPSKPKLSLQPLQPIVEEKEPQQKTKRQKYAPSQFNRNVDVPAPSKDNRLSPTQAKGQIKITQQHAALLKMSNMIKEEIKPEDLYNHIDKSIAMKFYLNCGNSIQVIVQDEKDDNDGLNDICIINLDLHCNDNNLDTAYCVALRNSDVDRNQKWIMKEGLYTAKEIEQTFKISSEKLPNSDREYMKKQFKDKNEIEKVAQLFAKKEMQDWVAKKKWCDKKKIPISGIIENKERLTLKIRKEEFIEHLQKSCAHLSMLEINVIQSQLKPVLIFDKAKKYHIQYVQKVQINHNNTKCDVLISWEYNEMNKDHNIINPTGVHLHTKHVQSSYQLLTLDYKDKDGWFSSFQCDIEEMQIGNPDTKDNIIKHMRKKQNENTNTSALQKMQEQLEQARQEIEDLKRQLEASQQSQQFVVKSVQIEQDE
eukprot:CAMPEP_0201594826 /NCGR_PEP_ID=MMETSP0190_2-20130828/192025_1 /ASSEMBLY_ACC=CAM_ASM_000263 /TAXON_ID=37353 /ORGANISM="Rosalina sp." /LENGTH=1042 /DNA_ID=CAMNT_0048054591 /DNA_START=564 /DNA_END=3693 /DNA_ORIENTATION=-